MKFIKLKRTFREGLDNFYRNGWLSFATVSVLAISLYVISVTIILGISADIILKNIQDKINVSVYFNSEVPESRILEIKSKLAGYQEIQSVDYVSKEQALDRLKKDNDKDSFVSQALEMIDGNPLPAALVIKAKNPNQYDLITKSITGASFSSDITKIDYQDNQAAIERFVSVIKFVKEAGFAVGVVFIFIGILITFNAIRLTMYAHKQEFEIMRLVGASNTYIKMPFVFEGIFYGLVSAVVVMLALFVTSRLLVPITRGSIGGSDILSFYLKHFFPILGSLIVSGIFLGTVSGIIAIRRYLKI
jgi:cell division transport system permease protein